MGTHRKSHEGRLKKTLAAGAIAGAAVGFGALAAAPSAFADNNDNEGWWLGSGNANNNNTIIGQVGSGNANQFGNFNGNIMNNQLNALSPVIGGTAVQANTTSANHEPGHLPTPRRPHSTAVPRQYRSTPVRRPQPPRNHRRSSWLASNRLGANVTNTGGQIPIPINIPVNTTTGGIAIPVVPILSNVNPGGPTVNNNTGGATSATGGAISGETTPATLGDPDATNVADVRRGCHVGGQRHRDQQRWQHPPGSTANNTVTNNTNNTHPPLRLATTPLTVRATTRRTTAEMAARTASATTTTTDRS